MRSQRQIELRRQKVEELLSVGTPRQTILAMLKGDAGLVRTIDRDMAAIRARWKTERMLREDTAVEERLIYMQKTVAFLKNQGAFSPMARYDDMINDVLAVYAPQRVDMRAAVVTTQAPDSFNYNELDLLPDEHVANVVAAGRAYLEACRARGSLAAPPAGLDVVGDAAPLPASEDAPAARSGSEEGDEDD